MLYVLKNAYETTDSPVMMTVITLITILLQSDDRGNIIFFRFRARQSRLCLAQHRPGLVDI